jgi:non-ribosomal peptide synthetase component F
VPHRQLLNRLRWMWAKYPFGDDEVSCQKTALSFVDSLWELPGPLLQGSPKVVLSDVRVREPKALVDALSRHQVTRL